jgi:hypothetical protein
MEIAVLHLLLKASVKKKDRIKFLRNYLRRQQLDFSAQRLNPYGQRWWWNSAMGLKEPEVQWWNLDMPV